MNPLKKIFVIVLVSSLLSLSACAKEVETASIEASEVTTQQTDAKKVDVAAVAKNNAMKTEAVKVEAKVSETAVSKSVEIKEAVVAEVEADIKEAGVRTVAMTTSAAEASAVAVQANETLAKNDTQANSQWVKVEGDDKLETVKPSGNYAVPVSEELGLGTAEEFLGLDKHKGKVIYVDFWASWCIPCRDSFPFMNTVQEKYPDDLVVLAVNLDEDKANAEKFLEVYPANFEIIYDQLWQAGREYGVYGLPFSFIYNRKGELVGKHGGFKDGDEINLDAALNNLITSGE